ncbi:hypothetical protein GCU56_17245 [Geodermatophilus sabuli]|uniref:Uncharacterized protein n=1 Tax=Geodermatophilus sabuli TaxID=1564158 RepID=A0A7K3W402_9ACTN|nr:hypothetical protein [Geodermatophilus sabuli]NEK59605.1 hypothetical protein [Geodermatophilus sabuli]
MHLLEIGPDDERFAAWCEVWAATQRADRPEDPPRPASDHRALARRLLAPAARCGRRPRPTSEVDEPAGRGFALRHGWSCDLVESRRDLTLPPDEARLSALEEQARAAGQG